MELAELVSLGSEQVTNTRWALPALVAAAVGLSVWAVGREFYLSWFRAPDFLAKSVAMVGSWWPFATYFKSYYGSRSWLWVTRIVTSILLAALLWIVFGLALAVVGVQV